MPLTLRFPSERSVRNTFLELENTAVLYVLDKARKLAKTNRGSTYNAAKLSGVWNVPGSLHALVRDGVEVGPFGVRAERRTTNGVLRKPIGRVGGVRGQTYAGKHLGEISNLAK